MHPLLVSLFLLSSFLVRRRNEIKISKNDRELAERKLATKGHRAPLDIFFEACRVFYNTPIPLLFETESCYYGESLRERKLATWKRRALESGVGGVRETKEAGDSWYCEFRVKDFKAERAISIFLRPGRGERKRHGR